jgi:hypothetical protein
MVGLDDFGMKLHVVGNIQFLFVVQESVKFFPLKKVVNQFAKTFLVEYFEGLGNFDFAIEAVLNLLFEFQRFDKSSGSKHDKVFRVKNQLVLVVFSIGDLKACRM